MSKKKEYCWACDCEMRYCKVCKDWVCPADDYDHFKEDMLKKYKDGLCMKNFKHLPEVSHYNFNYYNGIDKDLLFALSDDDNTTEWWLLSGESSYYIGESYVSTGEILTTFESRNT